MNDKVILVFCSCPDDASAKHVAEILVTERLASCVNRLASVTSTYVWDGRLQNDAEVLLIMKTVETRLPALTARVISLHPYELPEVVAVPVTGGNERYLEWVRLGATAKENT